MIAREREQPFASSLVPLVPAVLLCIVALAQVYLTRTADLSPWKGGGFGMFSSTDWADRGGRPIRVHVRNGELGRDFPLPSELGVLSRRAAVLPSNRNLRQLASAVAAKMRAEGSPVSEVVVEVWRRRYEPRSLSPRVELVRRMTVAAEAREGP